ncbi:MAG TPA: RES family NAD+ phosphorylase [Thermoanaerobaculia bacterium]|nr:RES family NAD+ phosphorylase [Thermoanaerobaculia bacterium]
MLPEPEIRKSLARIPLISVGGPWTRVLAHHLLLGPPPDGARGTSPQPLWPGGPVLRGARFNPKGAFGGVYLASDPVTALEEVGANFESPGEPVTLRTPPWTVFAVDGFLERVLDLTDPGVQRRLSTTIAELTGDWRFSQTLHLSGAAPLPPTQMLGKAAYESGRIVAIRYHSAKLTGRGTGFVVFADRLSKGSSVLEVYDPNNKIRQRLP